jgi:hypothetical protein
LAFFPGMDVPAHRKAALLRQALRTIREQFTLVTMSTHARALARRTDLRVRQPVASVAGSER